MGNYLKKGPFWTYFTIFTCKRQGPLQHACIHFILKIHVKQGQKVDTFHLNTRSCIWVLDISQGDQTLFTKVWVGRSSLNQHKFTTALNVTIHSMCWKLGGNPLIELICLWISSLNQMQQNIWLKAKVLNLSTSWLFLSCYFYFYALTGSIYIPNYICRSVNWSNFKTNSKYFKILKMRPGSF